LEANRPGFWDESAWMARLDRGEEGADPFAVFIAGSKGGRIRKTVASRDLTEKNQLAVNNENFAKPYFIEIKAVILFLVPTPRENAGGKNAG
jgi:hypothetical protein